VCAAPPSWSILPRAYRLDGTPATDATQGIVIENGKKVVRR